MNRLTIVHCIEDSCSTTLVPLVQKFLPFSLSIRSQKVNDSLLLAIPASSDDVFADNIHIALSTCSVLRIYRRHLNVLRREDILSFDVDLLQILELRF